MPAAGTPDLIAAFQELVDARPDFELAQAMYEGENDDVFFSPKVKKMLAKARANDIEEFNYAHIPVDTVVNRLGITAVTVVAKDEDAEATKKLGAGRAPAAGKETDDEDAKPEAPKNGRRGKKNGQAAKADAKAARIEQAQKELDRIWRENQLDAEIPDLLLKTCRDGDGYLMAWPRDTDNGKTVDIRVNDACTVRSIYDAEDPLKVAHDIKSWTYDIEGEDGKKHQLTRANLYYRDRVERFISLPDKKGAALKDPLNWRPYEPKQDKRNPDDDDREPAVIEHDYGRVVFHFRTARPYGKPLHKNAFGPQQMLNKLVHAQAVAIDFQSFPQRYILMDPAVDQVMQNFLDPDHPEVDDDPEGEGNVSQLSGDPSAIWRLFGVKNIGEFQPQSPDTFLKPFDRYVQSMGELTETPLYRFGSAFAQTPSGAALRAADAPTVNRVETLQSAFDAELEDALEFALRLLGFDDVQVKVTWKPAEQATDFEAWSVIDQKIKAGVPRKQALMEAGYPEDQVDEWLSSEEAANAKLLRQVDVVTKVAEALQSVGAAMSMNVIDDSQAATLVALLFGDMNSAVMARNDENADNADVQDVPEAPTDLPEAPPVPPPAPMAPGVPGQPPPPGTQSAPRGGQKVPPPGAGFPTPTPPTPPRGGR